MGVSSENGSRVNLNASSTFSAFQSAPMASAISAKVGSRESSCCSLRLARVSLLIVSTMCTGMRMVRAWSAMARLMACLIHQVA